MDQLVDAFKAVGGLVLAIGLAIFAKKYADLKRKEQLRKAEDVLRKVNQVIDRNDSTPIDDLMDRENKRFWSGFYSKGRKDN